MRMVAFQGGAYLGLQLQPLMLPGLDIACPFGALKAATTDLKFVDTSSVNIRNV